ncbi:hypothetical protein QE380_002690 [Acinetobacter baylyi]|uniref:DNA-binding protein n=1 Tax=Acinetobacter baylyi TaxID=202950 RepID=A0ABU0UYY6_ACIBI|nr:hypothetical protein [Acinetobacter baylyi]MDQ1209767.1 hypothetical protein [Acinetobacter baylyi]MDR6106637.1 hypothetical protein [Acinetobacter baylyi]MDR6186636.1 hypothetical protein [Acinetobacter baylyi]
MSNEKLLEKVILKMLQQLDAKPIIPIEHQLWDLDDIAKYFKYSADYTKRHIITNPYFPPSRDLPTTGDHTVPRWRAKDVISFGMAFDKANINYK